MRVRAHGRGIVTASAASVLRHTWPLTIICSNIDPVERSLHYCQLFCVFISVELFAFLNLVN